MTSQDLVQLSLLLDGELSAAESAALRSRLSEEPELRRAYERLQRLGSVVLLPTALDAKASTEALQSLGLAPPRATRWPLGAGVVVLVLGAALLALQPAKGVEPLPQEPRPAPPVAAPPIALTPPAEVPTVTLPADGGRVVLSVPREGEWIKVRGAGSIEFGGTPLALEGEAMLAVDRGGAGRVDAPAGTRSTEFFTTPGGGTIVAFVLSGSISLLPMAAPPASRPPRTWRVLVGQRFAWPVAKESSVRVQDASILRARVLSTRWLEVQGLQEGVTTIETQGGENRSYGVEVTSRDASGHLARVIDVGDVQSLSFPGLVRWSPGDRVLVRVEGRKTQLTLTGLQPGRTNLQLWFEDGRTETWNLEVPDTRDATFGLDPTLSLDMRRRGLLRLLPHGAKVAVEPETLAQVIPLEATSAAIVPLGEGRGKIVVTETSGAKHMLRFDVH